MAVEFRFSINASELADALQTKVENIFGRVQAEVEKISVGAHAFIVAKANTELTGYKRESFLGKDNKNVRWSKISDSHWVVEIDESSSWVEHGREPTFMGDWLLKSPKAKTAKDGCVLNPRNRVLTTNGWVKIKDIKPGDEVLTHSGKFHTVKALLVSQAGLGTKYVNFYINSNNGLKNGDPLQRCHPSISLTLEHPVLTPNGWVEAGALKKGDLVATAADLCRTCKQCGQPLPINAVTAEFCLNNSCARTYSIVTKHKGLGARTVEQRIISGKRGNAAAKASGCFDRPDWGARNPEVLSKLRQASAASCRKLLGGSNWHPETAFESFLANYPIQFTREHPIKTDRMVNAGAGRLRQSTLFLDFYFPALNLAIELDGKHWHSKPDAIERDAAKNEYCRANNIRLIRIPSHKIYKIGPKISSILNIWSKNHSGQLGIAWVRVGKIKHGIVNRKDHVYSKKYDICLDADEHSFLCETVFIHNSKYMSIPFPSVRQGKSVSSPVLSSMVKTAMKQEGISMKKIEHNPDGTPKMGVIHKLNIPEPGGRSQFPGLFSAPRSSEMSKITGLPAHGGIFKLQDTVIMQRMNQKGKVVKEAVTFRTISSKHKAEGRWMYPKVEAFNSLQAAHDWAMKEWEGIAKALEAEWRS